MIQKTYLRLDTRIISRNRAAKLTFHSLQLARHESNAACPFIQGALAPEADLMELSELCPARRNQLSIIAGFLETAKRRATKNQIRRRANLSTERLEHYLMLATAIGLLDRCAYTGEYKTTEKGIRFLWLFDSIQEFFDTKSKKEYRNGARILHEFRTR